MLRRDYKAAAYATWSFGEIFDLCMDYRSKVAYHLIHEDSWGDLHWYQGEGPGYVADARHLLIVSPSGEVRTLRDPDIGLDVLPADWHERTGEELFALGKPFAFGGEPIVTMIQDEQPAETPSEPEPIEDDEYERASVPIEVEATKADGTMEFFFHVPCKYDGDRLVEDSFRVPNYDAIARKAARERVEHLRSVRDAIGWPFV